MHCLPWSHYSCPPMQALTDVSQRVTGARCRIGCRWKLQTIGLQNRDRGGGELFENLAMTSCCWGKNKLAFEFIFFFRRRRCFLSLISRSRPASLKVGMKLGENVKSRDKVSSPPQKKHFFVVGLTRSISLKRGWPSPSGSGPDAPPRLGSWRTFFKGFPERKS